MKKFLPFEEAILNDVRDSLPPGLQDQFKEQVARINKVQRLLEWREVEFYCMRWFRVGWPAEILFNSRDELLLGTGTLRAHGMEAVVKVWAVGGHVFSIESNVPLKPFRSAKGISFSLAGITHSIATVDESAQP